MGKTAIRPAGERWLEKLNPLADFILADHWARCAHGQVTRRAFEAFTAMLEELGAVNQGGR